MKLCLSTTMTINSNTEAKSRRLRTGHKSNNRAKGHDSSQVGNSSKQEREAKLNPPLKILLILFSTTPIFQTPERLGAMFRSFWQILFRISLMLTPWPRRRRAPRRPQRRSSQTSFTILRSEAETNPDLCTVKSCQIIYHTTTLKVEIIYYFLLTILLLVYGDVIWAFITRCDAFQFK